MSPNLHGNNPDKTSVALLLIDVINDMDFPGSTQLIQHAVPMAQRIAVLRKKATELHIPVIYVNDNFGRWRSDFSAQVDHCLRDGTMGKPVVELLKPAPEDFSVLKLKHSGFFSTTLDIVLKYLQARTLILTGMAGNICVLFTAQDAFLRDDRLVIPADCIASNTLDENRRALEQMRKILKADTRPSTDISLQALNADGDAVIE